MSSQEEKEREEEAKQAKSERKKEHSNKKDAQTKPPQSKRGRHGRVVHAFAPGTRCRAVAGNRIVFVQKQFLTFSACSFDQIDYFVCVVMCTLCVNLSQMFRCVPLEHHFFVR